MKKCLYCNELIADKQEYCLRGHKQEVKAEDVPEFLKSFFAGFDKQPKDVSRK